MSSQLRIRPVERTDARKPSRLRGRTQPERSTIPARDRHGLAKARPASDVQLEISTPVTTTRSQDFDDLACLALLSLRVRSTVRDAQRELAHFGLLASTVEDRDAPSAAPETYAIDDCRLQPMGKKVDSGRK